MNNPASKNNDNSETSYDDMQPASTTKPNNFGTMVVSLLLNEVSATLEDVNKILALLDQFEKSTTRRTTLSGEVLPSPFAESLERLVKRSGLEETLREQLTRLQGSAIKSSVETNLRLYWHKLRERGARLRVVNKQNPTSATTVTTEQYQNEEPFVYHAPILENQTDYVATAVAPSYPLQVDVFDEPTTGEIVLVAEHPNLWPQSIHFVLNHDILILSATDTNNQECIQECLLPSAVEPNNYTQTYHNGILEIRFKKVNS